MKPEAASEQTGPLGSGADVEEEPGLLEGGRNTHEEKNANYTKV